MEGIKGPSGPRELFSFHSQEAMQDCGPFSDADSGGYSKARLDWIPPNSAPGAQARSKPSSYNPNGHARFHGSISTRLPENRPQIERSGYAAWRTKDRPYTIFGRSLWDLDPYVFLAFRFKSDGRSYHVNIQTESIVESDIHQHRLFSKRPGEWETALIRINDFVRTNHGFVVEPQTEMLRQKIRTVGIGLTDRIQGPFDLYIERIWATNNPREADFVDAEHEVPNAGQLKSKDGKSIQWNR